MRAGLHQFDQIAFQPHHQHLAFGIAEARIVFDQLRAVFGQHQPGIEHARIGRTLGGHGAHRRLDDLAHDLTLQILAQYRSGGIGAHAAGVRSGIARAHALVILRGADGHDRRAIGQREEAGLLAHQELLDHHFAARAAELAVEHLVERVLGFFVGFGDDHALARGEPVSLEHERRIEALERAPRLFERDAALVACGGNVRALAQLLGEALAAFELRGFARGTEGVDPRRAQRIGEPVDQRSFGADHHQGDRIVRAEGDYGIVVAGIQRGAFGMLCDTRVARRRPQLVAPRRLRQFPRQCMFAPARPE